MKSWRQTVCKIVNANKFIICDPVPLAFDPLSLMFHPLAVTFDPLTTEAKWVLYSSIPIILWNLKSLWYVVSKILSENKFQSVDLLDLDLCPTDHKKYMVFYLCRPFIL